MITIAPIASIRIVSGSCHLAGSCQTRPSLAGVIYPDFGGQRDGQRGNVPSAGDRCTIHTGCAGRAGPNSGPTKRLRAAERECSPETRSTVLPGVKNAARMHRYRGTDYARGAMTAIWRTWPKHQRIPDEDVLRRLPLGLMLFGGRCNAKRN